MDYGINILTNDPDETIGENLTNSFFNDFLKEDSEYRLQRVDELLSVEQVEALKPIYLEPTDYYMNWNNHRGVNPNVLIETFSVIYNDIYNNQENYPKIYLLDNSITTNYFSCGTKKCILEGYTHSLEFRNEVILTCISADGKISKDYIHISDEQEEIKIGDRNFQLRKLTLHQLYKNRFDGIISLCKKASSMNCNVILYGLI